MTRAAALREEAIAAFQEADRLIAGDDAPKPADRERFEALMAEGRRKMERVRAIDSADQSTGDPWSDPAAALDVLTGPPRDGGSGPMGGLPLSSGPGQGSWGAVVAQAMFGNGIRGEVVSNGTVTVPTPIRGPIEEPRRGRFLSQLMPTLDAPGGAFAYLQQTVRDNNAAVVADGAVKPTSVYTMERVDDTTKVIAHLSEPIPRRRLTEGPLVASFVDAELRLGLNLAIDARIVSEVTGATGILTEGALSDVLFTTRRALTRLEEREVVPSAYAMSPRDWEEVERAPQDTFAANPGQTTPVDAMTRRLWGVPVFTTNAITEGTILLGDFRGSAAIYQSEGIRIDWTESTYDSGAGATDFQRNLLRFRAETMLEVAVLRPFAFVLIEAPDTGS